MIGKLWSALGRYGDVGPLCLRIAIGIIFLAHGGQKLFGWFGGGGLGPTGAAFDAMGFQPGLLWAGLTGGVEFLGGLALLLGCGTRLAALCLGIVMLVALVKVHWPNGFFLNFAMRPGMGHGIEYNVALLGGCLALLFGGPGKYALECKTCKSEPKN